LTLSDELRLQLNRNHIDIPKGLFTESWQIRVKNLGNAQRGTMLHLGDCGRSIKKVVIRHLHVWLTSLIVAAVSAYVYWFGNGSLYLSHWNAQLAASLREFQYASTTSTLGVFWSPLEGLGQRSLESPAWLNLSYSHMLLTSGRFSETFFGFTIGTCIFLSSYFLARRLQLSVRLASVVGIFSMFVLFLPSPFMWQRQSGQSGGLISLAIAVPLGLALVNDLLLTRRKRITNLGFFALVVFLFTYAFGTGSALFLISLIIGSTPVVMRQIFMSQHELRWAVSKCLVFVICVLPQLVPQYSFIALHRQSGQIAPTNRSFGAAVSSYWNDLGAVFPWYRVLVLSTLVGLFVVGGCVKRLRFHAVLGWLAIGFPFIVVLINTFAIRQGIGEVLPSSTYFLIGLIPLAVGMATSIAAVAIAEAQRLSVWRSWIRPKKPPALVLNGLAITVLLLWAVIWSVDNQQLRTQKVSLDGERAKSLPLVQPIIEELECTLLSLMSAPTRQTFCGRVLLIDSERQLDTSVPRRDPLWVAALYAPLTLHGVPVVNAYGSRYSGPYYQFTNQAFTDGSQSIRAWVPFNQFDPSIARLFGVRVVITDRLIPELGKEREFSISDGDGNNVVLYQYQLRSSNLQGISVSRILQAESYSEVVDGLSKRPTNPMIAYTVDKLDNRSVQLTKPIEFSFSIAPSDVFVRGVSNGTSVVLLPFEYSSCLQISLVEGSDASLVRLNGIQLAIEFSGEIEGVIRLVDRGIGFRSCWGSDVVPQSVLQ
jgi:hypothetical protein